METIKAKTLRLNDVEFTQEMGNLEFIPLTEEKTQSNLTANLPKDVLKSSTVESLISQNEDLMARLKVTLRRLSILEGEAAQAQAEAQTARFSLETTSDQILILKEKDQVLRQKTDRAEKEKEIFQEKAEHLQTKLIQTEAELQRHSKYHDRIKTYVKPYLSQLKEFSKTQEFKIRKMESELSQKEALLRDVRGQIIEVTKHSRMQIENADRKNAELVQYYEEQVEKLRQENLEYQQKQNEMEIKTAKLQVSLERQDSLENEVVSLRRSKDDLIKHYEGDLNSLRDRLGELSMQNQRLGVEHTDLQARSLEDQTSLDLIQKENYSLKEQLEGLRFMWNSKNDENEKLKMHVQALEKLNLDLSQKLNEMRKTDA